MKNLFNIILAHPKLVLAVALVCAAVGWRVGKTLPVDVFPEIREARVVVQVEAGGLTAEEVEQRVTIPIEAVMNGIAGVRKVRSSSGGGLAFVWVEFDWDTDLMQARYSVFERLASVRESLPEEVRAEIAPIVSITGEIMLVALTCPNGEVSPLALREMGEFDLRTRLLGVPGVGEVVVVGGRLPEYQVLATPEKLAQYGLALSDVVAAASSSRTLASAGYLPHFMGEEIPLRQVARADSLETLKRVKLPTRAAEPLRLGDVASVGLGGAPRRGSASFGGQSAVLLSVQKAPGGNTPELTKQLDAILDEFEAAHKSDGIEVHREAYRQADFIGLSIDEGRSIIRDAVLIVILVLGLTLLKFRTILITLVTMPLSVLVGLALFPCFGLGINVMTLGGLAVGIGDIVDSAIIFVEIIWRRLGENAALSDERRRSEMEVVGSAVREVMPSVLFSTTIIFLVFVPLLMLTGLESRFFAPLAQSYLLVFGVSFAVAVAVVPALSVLLWRTGKTKPRPQSIATGRGGESIVARGLKAAYRPILLVCLKYPKTLCSVMVLALAGMIYMASGFGASFIQSFHEDAFTVIVSAPPGTSLDETERLADNAAETIGAIPGVISVLRRTGRAERDQHAEPPSVSELVVRVDMKADTNDIRKSIRTKLGTIPGISTMVGYPIAHRISAALSGTEAELAINVFGEDLVVLRDVAKKVKEILEKLPVVADVRANREILVTTYRVDYDLEALAEADLTLQEAGEQVSAAFNGKVVGTVRQGLKARDIVVRLDPEGGELTPGTLKAFMLASSTGKYRRLEEVAHVYREEASNLIIREQTRRKALITCNAAADSDTGTLVKTLREAIEPTIRAAGCTVSYGGSYEARQSAGRRLALMGIALIGVIFLLLTLALKSSRAAAIVMLNVPLSLIGGIVAVWMTNPVLSVASLVGFVTVVGFVLRNGLLLVNRYRELEESGLSRHEAIVKGSCERMMPILMTSLTTILGLVPIVMAADKPGGELLAPLAIVQFGGLLSASVLNMLVLPAVVSLCGKSSPPARPVTVVTLLLVAGLWGCRSYEARTLDFAHEMTAWNDAGANVKLETLKDAEKLALVANPEINQLRLKALRRKEEAKDVGWWDDPELDFDFLRILKADDYPNLFGGKLSFTVPLSGVPGLEARAAELYAEEEVLSLRAAERRLCVDVRTAAIRWVAAARREETLRTMQEDASVTNAFACAVRLFGMGEVNEADLSTARRRRHDRSHALRNAELATVEAKTAFCRLLGVSPTANVTLSFDVWSEEGPIVIAMPEELTRHEAVRAALVRLEGKEAAFHAEVRRQYPNLTLGPAYEREDNLDRVGFVASLTLPLWNRNRKAIAQSETERDLAHRNALDVWKELVWNSVMCARRYRQLSKHMTPEGLDRGAVDRLHGTGELSDIAYLAVCDEILESKLEEITWREQMLISRNELTYYTIEK